MLDADPGIAEVEQPGIQRGPDPPTGTPRNHDTPSTSTLWNRGHLVFSSGRRETLVPSTLRPPAGADAAG
jgi:hypothetical protein